MLSGRPSHSAAITQALFVTFLWSTSWVLIKWGLQDIPALTFAGLRYWLAFSVLLPFALSSQKSRQAIRRMTRREWWVLACYGVLFVAVTQGAQFMGLGLLPAATVSLLLYLSPVLVALFGIFALAEKPQRQQWAGVVVYVGGIIVYFAPAGPGAVEFGGVAVVLVAVVANAISSVLGRHINRSSALSPLLITTVSMGFGAAVLLASGIAAQGIPALSAVHWFYIVWLAMVNTALAFPIWNSSLRTLTAVESSIINSTMLVQIAVLAFLFLGERLDWWELVGMGLVGIGVLWVQLAGKRK